MCISFSQTHFFFRHTDQITLSGSFSITYMWQSENIKHWCDSTTQIMWYGNHILSRSDIEYEKYVTYRLPRDTYSQANNHSQHKERCQQPYTWQCLCDCVRSSRPCDTHTYHACTCVLLCHALWWCAGECHACFFWLVACKYAMGINVQSKHAMWVNDTPQKIS